MGFDPFAEWIGEEKKIKKKIGEGKVYPMDPECMFNGKTYLASAAALKVAVSPVNF
jgi:hypothetical protein